MSRSAQAREILRKLNVSYSHVPGTDLAPWGGTNAVAGGRLSGALANGEPLHRIQSEAEFYRACAGEIKRRLGRAAPKLAQGTSAVAYDLLLALVCENLFASSEGFSIAQDIEALIASSAGDLDTQGLDADDRKALEGHLAANSVREALLLFTDRVFDLDGRELMERLDIPLATTYAQIDPDWVSKYQSPDRPLQFWMDHETDGRLVFIIYYSGRCTYLQCYGCALPSLSRNTAVPPDALFAQTDYVLDRCLTEAETDSMRTVVLSNNGSMFDDPTFSPTALHYSVIRCLSAFPNLRKLVLESRAEFIDQAKLAALVRCREDMSSNVTFEIALGVEVFDEQIRNKVARKGLSNRGIERLIELLGAYGIDLRCYFMLKPHPSMSDEEAYADIANALDLLDEMSERTGTRITMHLNPTYASIGTILEQALEAGDYSPPRLDDLESFLKSIGRRRTRIYLGLNDEGLAAENGTFLRPEHSENLSRLRRYNMISDVSALSS